MRRSVLRISLLRWALTALLMAVAMGAHADKTLRGRLKALPEAVAPQGKPFSPYDTITAPGDSLVRLSGYDKPLNSRYESIFVSNLTDEDIVALTLRITYRDTSGRTLHELTRELRGSVPPGATRRLQFKSWDRQFTFYYVKGRRPRTANVTPYDLSCTIESIVILKKDPTNEE